MIPSTAKNRRQNSCFPQATPEYTICLLDREASRGTSDVDSGDTYYLVFNHTNAEQLPTSEKTLTVETRAALQLF